MSRTDLVVSQSQRITKRKRWFNLGYVFAACVALGGLSVLWIFLTQSGSAHAWRGWKIVAEFSPRKETPSLSATTTRNDVQASAQSVAEENTAHTSKQAGAQHRVVKQAIGSGESNSGPNWRRYTKLQDYSQTKQDTSNQQLVAVAAQERLEMPSFEELQGWSGEPPQGERPQQEQTTATKPERESEVTMERQKLSEDEQAALVSQQEDEQVILPEAIGLGEDTEDSEEIADSNSKAALAAVIHKSVPQASSRPTPQPSKKSPLTPTAKHHVHLRIVKLSSTLQAPKQQAASQEKEAVINAVPEQAAGQVVKQQPKQQAVALAANRAPLAMDKSRLSQILEQRENENSLAIIVNRDNTQNINQQQLRDIYLDRVSSWQNGEEITVYNLPLSSAGRELFSRQVLNMSALDAATLASNRRMTNQQSNHMQTHRQNLVAHFVAKNPMAIGYVPLHVARQKHDVRILFTIEFNNEDKSETLPINR